MAAKETKTVALREETLRRLIFNLRGQQVILDRDLATLYQVETRALKQAVKRNDKRFPGDFMFVLDESEVDRLVSQSVIPTKGALGGMTKVPSLIASPIEFDGIADRNLAMGAIAPRQKEVARLDAVIEVNLRELGYGG